MTRGCWGFWIMVALLGPKLHKVIRGTFRWSPWLQLLHEIRGKTSFTKCWEQRLDIDWQMLKFKGATKSRLIQSKATETRMLAILKGQLHILLYIYIHTSKQFKTYSGTCHYRSRSVPLKTGNPIKMLHQNHYHIDCINWNVDWTCSISVTWWHNNSPYKL